MKRFARDEGRGPGRAKADGGGRRRRCHWRVRRLSMSGWGKPFPHIRDGGREPGREGLGDGASGDTGSRDPVRSTKQAKRAEINPYQREPPRATAAQDDGGGGAGRAADIDKGHGAVRHAVR